MQFKEPEYKQGSWEGKRIGKINFECAFFSMKKL
jgi:hypothetical protein